MTAQSVHPRLAAALRTQLEHWRAAQRAGARRIGWKIGGDIDEIDRVTGGMPAIGHLTSASLLDDGDRYDAGGTPLHADTELVIEVGRDVEAEDDAAAEAIIGIGVALELVDLSRPPDDLEGIVAANVLHRAVVLGPVAPRSLRAGALARSIVDGEVRAEQPAIVDCAETVRIVARLLAAAGEGLRAGDRIIAGSLTQVPVRPGETIGAEIDGLGHITATIAAEKGQG